MSSRCIAQRNSIDYVKYTQNEPLRLDGLWLKNLHGYIGMLRVAVPGEYDPVEVYNTLRRDKTYDRRIDKYSKSRLDMLVDGIIGYREGVVPRSG